MKDLNAKYTQYLNGFEIKLENRRIKALEKEDFSFDIEFKRLLPKDEKIESSGNVIQQGRISYVLINLTQEAAMALSAGLYEYFDNIKA